MQEFAFIAAQSKSKKWVMLNKYTENQPNYSCIDHAVRDATLYARYGAWQKVEVRAQTYSGISRHVLTVSTF